MKKGFTLVELAIVLVVIGLLMGMAFKGKSLVDAAKLKADVRKIEKIETAINTYFAKYDTLPGKRPKANLNDPDTYSDKSIVDELIAQGMLNDADFKLTSFATKIHFAGCDLQPATVNGESYLRWNAVAIDVNTSLCVTFSTVDHTDDITKPSPINTTLIEYHICTIEKLLDDSNIYTGDGRKSASSHNSDIAYTDCSKYVNDPTGNTGVGSPVNNYAYLYKVY